MTPAKTAGPAADHRFRRLFEHLRHSREDRARAKLAVTVFGLLILIAGTCIFAGERFEATRCQDQLKGVETQARYLASPGITKGNPFFDDQVRQLFFFLHFSWAKTPEDHRELRRLGDLFDAIARSSLPEKTARLEDFEHAARQIVLDQHPLVQFKVPLNVWLAFGFFYWLTIFMLYGFVMRPADGEPIFNVLDVAFLAVLIEYSGGIFSLFLLLFGFSLLLSAADFCYQPATRRAVERLIPYVLAVFLHLFWAVSREVMLRRAPMSEYLLQAGILLVVGTLSWLVFMLIIQYVTRHRPMKTQPAHAR